MNPELLDKLTKVITKNPERFDMSEWAQKAECGTVACIAGWVLLLRGYSTRPSPWSGEPLLMFNDPQGKPIDFTAATAAKELGLSEPQADRLFDVARWPDKLFDRYVSGDKTAAVDMLNLIAAENNAAPSQTMLK